MNTEMKMMTASAVAKPKEDHLEHYGILGMRWGIRRFQDYGEGGYNPKDKGKFFGKHKFRKKNDNTEEKNNTQVEINKDNNQEPSESPKKQSKATDFLKTKNGDLVVTTNENGEVHLSQLARNDIKIPKGANIYKQSSVDKENNDGGMYAYFTENDEQRYAHDESDFVGYIRLQFKTTEELNIPSYKKRLQTFINVWASDDKSFLNSGDNEKQIALGKEIVAQYKDKKESEINYPDLYTSVFDAMNYTAKNNKGYSNFREKYINELKKQGYNATIDDNDTTKQGNIQIHDRDNHAFSEAPLYVFDSKKSLIQTGSTPSNEYYDEKFKEDDYVEKLRRKS